jgi:hypothetical protein
MSVILDIDLDHFPLFDQPLDELERLLTWAGRPVDFVVEHHHKAYKRWKQMVTAHVVELPHLIIHVDEHHDMLSERQPANCGNFVYFAMRYWSDCQVVWVTPQPIDYPDIWLSDDGWEHVSSRFDCAKQFRRHWAKPDVVSRDPLKASVPEKANADIWITEVGRNVATRKDQAVAEREAAAVLVKLYVMAMAQGIRCACNGSRRRTPRVRNRVSASSGATAHRAPRIMPSRPWPSRSARPRSISAGSRWVMAGGGIKRQCSKLA